MACKEDRFTCGDRTYLIRQMPPRQAVPVQVYLAKTLGQPIFKAFATGGLNKEAAMSMAFALFAERLEDEGLLKIMSQVFRYVGILGQKIRICEENDLGAGLDEAFLGRNKELWQVLVKALEVNFADFFGGALSLSTILGKLRASISPNPPTSTSSSGDPVSATQSSAETSTS